MWLTHALLMCLFCGWIVLALWGWFSSSKSKQPYAKVNASWTIAINSAVLYALAFNIIFFIQELFLALGKYWLGLRAVLYHNNHNWFDDHPKDALAQGYGAFAIFITGILLSILFFAMKPGRSWLRLFIFWMAYQGLIQSLPQFATAVMDRDTDTGQAFTYLGWSETTGYVLFVVCTVLTVMISLVGSKILLSMAPSGEYLQHPKQKFGYAFKIALMAGVIGLALIFPFRIPPLDRAMAPMMLTLISVPWIFANAWRVKKVVPHGNTANDKVLMLPILLLAILLLIFQWVLRPGVEFNP